MTPDIELSAIHGTSWSFAQYAEYFSDEARFAETLQQNGEEVRKRMAELFSILSSSLQSWFSFPPSGLNPEQIQRIFTVAERAGLFSLNQLTQPKGHLFFDSFIEACLRKPALAAPFIRSGLLVSEPGFELICKKDLREAVEAILEKRVALAPPILKKLILSISRLQSPSMVQALNLPTKYWEYGLQQCCLAGDQRAASFLVQNVPFPLSPIFRALILGDNEKVIHLLSSLSPEEKRGAFQERLPVTNQTLFQLAKAFKNEEIYLFLLGQSRMDLTISNGSGRAETIPICALLLTARSEVLKELLLVKGETHLTEEKLDQFLDLIAYLHTDNLNKIDDHFVALYTVAHKYGITGLKEVFVEWLQEFPGVHDDKKRMLASQPLPSPPQPPEIVFEQDANPLAPPYTEEDLLRKYTLGQRLEPEEFVTACSKGWMGFLKCALTPESIKACDKRSRPLLFIACQEMNLELFHLLLKRGANSSPIFTKGGTYLHWWAHREKEAFPFMQALLKAVPNDMRKRFVNHVDNNGKVALDLFSLQGPLRLLLEAGADPWLVNSKGQTILHKMAKNRAFKNISFLLSFIPAEKQSKYVNFKDYEGNTALHCVQFGGDAEISTIEALLEAGADLFSRNKAGQMPFALPFIFGTSHTYAAIPMFRSLSPEQRQRLSDFAATLYPDDGVRGGDTPLHTLCKNSHFSAEEQPQVDPALASQRNQEGLLPLQIAILNGAAHLIGPICGEERLNLFKGFINDGRWIEPPRQVPPGIAAPPGLRMAVPPRIWPPAIAAPPGAQAPPGIGE